MSYNSPQYGQPDNRRRRRRPAFQGLKLRLLIAGAIVVFTLVSYYSKGQPNQITGETQRIDMSIQEEIMLGLQSVPQMGPPSANVAARRHVDAIGRELVRSLEASLYDRGIDLPYPFEFHLLADSQTVNAFALPGGQVFITEALYRSMTHDGQLAGVLGHEIGHVIARHGAERITRSKMWQGVSTGIGVAGGDVNSGRLSQYVTNIIQMKYGRNDELESDRWGVELMILAGYTPEHLLTVMDILERSAGGGNTPELLSTHPKPANRQKYINDIIAERFPSGIPGGLR
ncbi:MAG: M48 family metallopeptidase [Planctomycetota bacterium]